MKLPAVKTTSWFCVIGAWPRTRRSHAGGGGDECRKDRKAETEEIVEAVTCVAVRTFGKHAEHAGQYLHKGRQVLIDGELRQDEWTDKESGEKRQRLYVVAQRIIYLGNGKGHGPGQTAAQDSPEQGEADIPF